MRPVAAADAGNFVGPGLPAEVCVVVVTYNSAADIALLIDDLRRAAVDSAIRTVVVDNQSSDATAEIVRAHADVEFVESGGNLGYAGGINVALPRTGPCEHVLILNPDLRVQPAAVAQMLATLRADPAIGVVVPRILDEHGETYPSLRFEPTSAGLLGDALFGRRFWLGRPTGLSEFDYRPSSYLHPHDIDWATGAALLIRGEVARELGPWDERFFLYSEETEYFRRVRDRGFRVRFDPAAVVQHRLGGSGSSQSLAALMAVNRIRYVELHHGKPYAAVFRGVVALSEALRSYDDAHRRTLATVLRRKRWSQLPKATKPVAAEVIPGDRRRGAVIVPAYNEAAVIERTLSPLSAAAVDGYIELIVVCNGCTDDTADRARTIPGARVVDLQTGSKPLALNTGDELATLWPRLYLDADLVITAATVIAVLDRLAAGAVLAARPSFRYGTDGASALVRCYYRARTRMALHENALWWAGVYGLSEAGHLRFGAFPDVTGDDLFVDSRFAASEKAVVDTEPSVWVTPTTTAGLLTVLGRHHRGNAELAQRDPDKVRPTGRSTGVAILRTVRGPQSAVDAGVYLLMAVAARRRAARHGTRWERDDTSRSSG